MPKIRQNHARQNRFFTYTVATALLLMATTTSALAWAVKSHYPSALEPTLPNATEAQRLVAQPGPVFQALRHAHRQSLERSWKSIDPPVEQNR